MPAGSRAKRLLIMVSGPYRSPTAEGRLANLRQLNHAAKEIFRRGHTPLVGVNLALPLIEASGMDTYDEIMMPLCLRLAERCDAILRIGGPSEGAEIEVAHFRARGGQVFHSVDEIPQCWQG